jgi:hypothetical protein
MNRLQLPRTPVGVVYVAALAALFAVSAGLGAALWAKAKVPPAVYLVTGNDDPKVVTPGIIPDALARDFARDFVVTLETYGPTTVEKNLAFLTGRIAPRALHEFDRYGAHLKKLVKDAKQASQLLVRDPGAATVLRDGKRVEVILRTLRRIYVDNALLQEASLVYRLALLPGEPTRENPTGLAVSGWTTKLESEEAARDQ